MTEGIPDRICAACGRAGFLDGADLVLVTRRMIWRPRAQPATKVIEAGRAICAYHCPECSPIGDQVKDFFARRKKLKPARPPAPGPIVTVRGGRKGNR